MIFYLVSKKHANTINRYLISWGKELSRWIRPLPYEKLAQTRTLRAGTYIFSDIERLSPEQAEMAAQVWKDLATEDGKVQLLNHPTYSMRRYELLRILYERSLNKFNVYRLTEGRMPQRFPVFLRGENDHYGSLTPLLQTPEELDDAINHIFQQGQSRENKIITEFCDTSDIKGIFRKYSAFIVGDRIIPRHIFFSHDWMLKKPNLSDEEMLQEEWQYVKSNPHEPQLREISQLTRINYGRIDYGLLNGELQVWEINTNPVTLWVINKNRDTLSRVPLHEHFSKQLKSAFEAINRSEQSGIRIPTSVKAKFSKRASLKELTINFILKPLPYEYQCGARKKLQTLEQLFNQ